MSKKDTYANPILSDISLNLWTHVFFCLIIFSLIHIKSPIYITLYYKILNNKSRPIYKSA